MREIRNHVISNGLPLAKIEVSEYYTVYKEVTWRVDGERLVSVDKNAIVWYDESIRRWRLNYTTEVFGTMTQAMANYSHRKWGIV